MRMTRVRGGGNAQGKGRHVRVDLSRTAGRGHREASGPRAPGSQGWGWQTLPLEQFPERASSLGLDHHVNSQPKDSFYPPVIKNQLGSPARGWESGPSGTGPAAPGCVRPRCLHARGRADAGTRASGLESPRLLSRSLTASRLPTAHGRVGGQRVGPGPTLTGFCGPGSRSQIYPQRFPRHERPR